MRSWLAGMRPARPSDACRVAGLTLLCTLGISCNDYALFSVAGYAQESFSNDADIIFVIDNSNSMEEEASALALNFNVFIDQLADPDAGAPSTESLADAVDNYITSTSDRGGYIDYQLGITTTAVVSTGGETSLVDPGEAGLLIGDPVVITNDDVGVAGLFRSNLLCTATCFSETTMPSDPNYQCGEDPGGNITQEYLDCECGYGGWEDHCGSGTEEHLEASLLAMCRAVENPPDVCFEDITDFTESDVGSNPGLIRDTGTIVVVVVTDEGDGSRRLDQGNEDPQVYLDAYEDFGQRIRFAVIGPNYDPNEGDGSCLAGATTWGTERLITVAEQTGGFYAYIADESDCDNEVADFSEHLETLGDLLNNLLSVFEFASIPDVSTLRVYVDGVIISEAILDEDTDQYGDGWAYDPSNNAVAFYGEAIPDYNAEVRIYYRPLEGKPRELPF